MNTPNPLIPQGTFPHNRGKSHLRIVFFAILAVHVVLLTVLLLQGCKRTTETTSVEPTNTYTPFRPDTNIYEQPTNLAPAVPTGAPPTTLVATQTPIPAVTPDRTPPAVPPAGEKEHAVAKNDSFYTLSKKYGVSSTAIAEANPGVDSKRLKIGQKLRIPAPAPSTSAVATDGATNPAGDKIYAVKSGDNLMKIAKAHGVSVKALRSANHLRTDQIKVGQKLKIPAKTAAPAAGTETPPAAGTTPAPAGTVSPNF